MKYIVGLGNPEDKFNNTKHNFGFWIIDKLIQKRSLKYKLGKSDYLYAEDMDCVFIKPTTYVNNSGIVIKHLIKSNQNISSNNLIIIYDDIDINLGNIRFKAGGSDGGHRGIKSIIYQLGTDMFDRLKIGIATDENMRPSEKYVLEPFSKEYKDLVVEVINVAVNSINYYLQHGIRSSMNRYNKKDDNNGRTK